jgi:hypothetical protein
MMTTCKSTIQNNKRLRWTAILVGSLLLFGILAFVLLHVVLLITGQESIDSAQDLRGFGDFSNVLDSDSAARKWAELHQDDLYDNVNSTQIWANGGNGLSLKILNALDDEWQPLWESVISDWRESQALRLTVERVTVDHSCARVQGVMKVCNANLGDTGYLGYNELETVGDVIVSSVAFMNEYYLYNADYERKQYTLCHELGHGFGLSHTDVNPYNQDTGDCMDYTVSPENNLDPGQYNFERLASMYMQHKNDDALSATNAGDGQYNAQYSTTADDAILFDMSENGSSLRQGKKGGQRALLLGHRVIQRHYLYI